MTNRSNITHVLDRDFQAKRRQFIGAWTDIKESQLAIAMREAVRLELGVSGAISVRRVVRWNRRLVASLRPIVRRIYEETQAALRQRGMFHVTLYRGVEVGGQIGLTLSSYTSDSQVARRFGRMVIEESISADRVFMWHGRPGMGQWAIWRTVRIHRPQGDACMKRRELTTVDGKIVTEYVPETDEDWDEIERMRAGGEIDSYGSFADVQDRAEPRPRAQVNSAKAKVA